MSVLVFVEAGDELSLQALALARGLGSPGHAVMETVPLGPVPEVIGTPHGPGMIGSTAMGPEGPPPGSPGMTPLPGEPPPA